MDFAPMELIASVDGYSEGELKMTRPSLSKDILYVRTKVAENVDAFFGRFKRDDDEGDNIGDEGNSGLVGGFPIPGPAQISSGLGLIGLTPADDGGDCDDDDDDEKCKTSSTTSANSATASSTPQITTTTALPFAVTTASPSISSTTPSSSHTSSTSTKNTAVPSPVQVTTNPGTSSMASQKTQSPTLTDNSSSSRLSMTTIIKSSIIDTTSAPLSSTSVTSNPVLPSSLAASQSISSAETRVDTKTQGGVIAAIVIGLFIAVGGIILVVRYSLHRRRKRNVGSSPPSSPLNWQSSSKSPGLGNWMTDVEQLRYPNPSHSITSTGESATISTNEIFAMNSPVKLAPSPGLCNNPVHKKIVSTDSSLKTIIKPVPFLHAKEITISSKKQTPKMQTTDIYVEEKSEEILPGPWPESLNKKPPPLAFDIVGKNEEGKAEKKTTLILEHKPGGRWSDPFTVAWRGSGEAIESSTRWKSARSWVKDQIGRLEDPERERKLLVEKVG